MITHYEIDYPSRGKFVTRKTSDGFSWGRYKNWEALRSALQCIKGEIIWCWSPSYEDVLLIVSHYGRAK